VATFDRTIVEQVRPNWLRDNYDTWSPAEQEKWLRLRDYAVPCTPAQWFFLANDLLGYDFQEDVHTELFAQFPQLDVKSGKHFYKLSEQIKKALILWSRGTFKTHSICVLIVACLLYDPDLVVLVISGSQDRAKTLIAMVKSQFERPSEKFDKLFPEYCKPKLGKMQQFTLPCRRNIHSGNPSVLLSSSKSAKAGLHPDLICVDDLVNETNFRNPAQLEKCWNDYQFLTPLLNPGGYVTVTGTRYSFGDTYEFIQEAAKKEEVEFGRSIWNISIKSCWKDDNQDHGPLFTPRVTKTGKTVGNSTDFLLHQKNEMGDEMFSCQYLNRVMSNSEKPFAPDLLARQTFYHLYPPTDDPNFIGPVMPREGIIFVMTDLAYAGKKQNDETVFYIFKVWNGQMWVFDCISGKMGSAELVTTLWEKIIAVYRPAVVFVEKINAWEAFDHNFRAYATQHNIQRYPVVWHQFSHALDAKKMRIGSAQSPLEQRRLWIYGNMPNYQRLLEQLDKYPQSGRYDDCADCLGMVVGVPTGWYSEAVSEGPQLPAMLRDMVSPDDETTRAPGAAGSVITCG